MIATNYYEKALSNFKAAKIIFKIAIEDEEQLNFVAYHLQQSLELAIKHILALHGAPIQKTHDIDQLITFANSQNIDLYLTKYLLDKSESISTWESKTRYILGFYIDVKRLDETIKEMEKYFGILSKKLS